jgi:hypothetical protein
LLERRHSLLHVLGCVDEVHLYSRVHPLEEGFRLGGKLESIAQVYDEVAASGATTSVKYAASGCSSSIMA